MTKKLKGAPSPKKTAKPVKVLSKEIAALVDPEVRKVHAALLQVKEMQARLDAVLNMAFPEWDKDGHIYIPDQGFFRKADAQKVPKPDDPTGAPMRRYGRKNG